MSFVHEALLYQCEAEYLANTTDFVRAGVRARQPVLVAVPGERLPRLRSALSDVEDAVRFEDMAVAGSNPNRILPWLLRAFVAEHPGRTLRIVGEPIWPGRSAAELALCVQHEALLNVVFPDARATILCPYDAAALDPAVISYAERTHPVLVVGESRRPSSSYTDPYTLTALLNQPLPEPATAPIEMVFAAPGLVGVRRLVGEQAQRAGLAPARVSDLQMAVNEIATNVVVHTSGPGRLRVWRHRDRLAGEDRIICEVSGPGEITDWLAGRIRPHDDSERGRGLLLANVLCDLIQTHTAPTGTVTRLHMAL